MPNEAQLHRSANLGGAGAVEGVGLQDVGPSFQELVVDASNDVGAGDDQQVIVALQLIRMALVPITPKVLLTQPVRARCNVKASGQSQCKGEWVHSGGDQSQQWKKAWH